VNFALACQSGEQKFVGFAPRFRFNETRWFIVSIWQLSTALKSRDPDHKKEFR
jgi:hypothetical protein